MAKKNTRPAKKAASQEKKPAAAKKTAAKKTAAKKTAPAKTTAPAKKTVAESKPRGPAANAAFSASTSNAAATKPAAMGSATTKGPAAKSNTGPTPPTTISAKVDIGFGNILYIRGEGPGLSWERGVPMDCVAADEWTWRTRSASGAFICKVLINDEIWSTGEDFHVPPGERLVCYPTF